MADSGVVARLTPPASRRTGREWRRFQGNGRCNLPVRVCSRVSDGAHVSGVPGLDSDWLPWYARRSKRTPAAASRLPDLMPMFATQIPQKVRTQTTAKSDFTLQGPLSRGANVRGSTSIEFVR